METDLWRPTDNCLPFLTEDLELTAGFDPSSTPEIQGGFPFFFGVPMPEAAHDVLVEFPASEGIGRVVVIKQHDEGAVPGLEHGGYIST